MDKIEVTLDYMVPRPVPKAGAILKEPVIGGSTCSGEWGARRLVQGLLCL